MSERTLLLLGGGHAHVEVLRSLARHRTAGVRIVVVSDVAEAPYSGMLPGVIAGFYQPEQSMISLAPLVKDCGAKLILSAATGWDPSTQTVRLADGTSLHYDLLSLNVGGVPDFSVIPGAREHAASPKPIRGYLSALNDWFSKIQAGDTVRWIQVGAGAAGIECTLAVAGNLRRRGIHLSGVVIERSAVILPNYNSGVRRSFEKLLADRDMSLRLSADVERIEPGRVVLASGEKIDADFISVSTPVCAPSWIAQSGVQCRNGYLLLNENLQSLSHPNVFGAGDAIDLEMRRLPRAGVYAVRQGPILAANLRRYLSNQALEKYKPQRTFLSILIDGDRHAVTSYGRWYLPNTALNWKLKDWIDRGFMKRYQVSLT